MPPLALPNFRKRPCQITRSSDSDGTFVENFQEHPQSMLLTDCIEPVLRQIHPDGNYAIGQDCGIYWRQTEPPEKGAEAPDWFYVPDVPPLLNSQIRRSYVMWKELFAPLIARECASGDGREERDRTPLLRLNEGEVTKPGKFWVYERIIRIPYYAIYVISTSTLEVYHLDDRSYRKLEPNAQGRYPIRPLKVELGVWPGRYLDQEQFWLRWWDNRGQLLPTGREAELVANAAVAAANEAAAEANERAQVEQQRAYRLAERLRLLGINPDDL